MKITVRKRTIFIFLTLIGLLAYFNSLSAPFHYDDISFLRENTFIKSFQLFLNWITGAYSRLITGRGFLLFTFYLNYLINGLDTFGYHLVNLFIHISVAFLFYLLMARYVYPSLSLRDLPPTHPSPSRGEGKGGGGIATPSARNDKWQSGLNNRSVVPILAAVLFLIHPINTESVTYISSRSSGLSAFFILASMLCFFRATSLPYPPLGKGGQEEGKNKFHLAFYFLSLLFFLIGLSTKEAAIVTPLLMVLFDLYFISDSDNGRNFKSRFKYHLPFWLIILAGSFYYSGYITRPAMYNRPWLTHILTELKVFVEYLRLLILPVGLNIDHDVKALLTLDLSAVFYVAILAGLLLTAAFLKNKNKILSFSIIWFFINLAPFLLIRLEDYMAERWVYAASIGFSLGISELLVLLYLRHKKLGIFIAASAVVLLGILAYSRNNVYKDPVTLWSDAAQKSPQKARPYTNLCGAYGESGDADKAIDVCRTAINKGGRDIETYMNLATAHFFKGNLNIAETILKEMAKNITSDKEAIEIYHYNLGAVYKAQKKYDIAIEEYKKIFELKPQSPAPLTHIGECYLLLGMKDNAEEYFRLATKGVAKNGDDYLMMAKSFFRINEAQKGFESLTNAVITEPLNVNIRYWVATTYLEIKNYDLAQKHFLVTIKLAPNHALAHKGMGLVMLAKGNIKDAKKYFNKALSLFSPASPEKKELLNLLENTGQ
ncbi:MAG: hypothetical protein HY755_05160 [Nitrospirae bacterium]|nr:hypothetical protein [Nitrospirota bacterium]